MTREELRALDAEVHRRVMGDDCYPLRVYKEVAGIRLLSSTGQGGIVDDMPWHDRETGEPIPRYSEDIAAAWMVFEKLLTIDESASIGRYCGVGMWEVGLRHDNMGATKLEIGETAPLAICRAALKAVEAVAAGAGDCEPTAPTPPPP